MLCSGQETAGPIGGGRLSSVGTKPGEPMQADAAQSACVFDWKRPLILGLLLVGVTAGLYVRVHGYGFVNYDDTLYVTQNSHVQDGLTWSTVRWAFTTYSVGTWHPITWLSHALDYQFFDVDAGGPHDINLLLHLLNVFTLFWVLLRATGYMGRSLMAAALFALHPINVESVVWIAERKNCLSLLFFLLALVAYRWYTEKPNAGRYMAVVALFALGLMAKPQVVSFPFVLLLWDYWPLRRISFLLDERLSASKSNFRQLVWEKIPLFALAGVSAAITMAAQRADGNKTWYPFSLRLGYAVVSYVQYIGKALWPVRLSPFYPHPDSVSLAHVAEAALVLGVVTLFVIALRRSRPYLLVGWFWFLGTLVPMLGLAGVGYQGKQGIADRYAYLPFIGLFIMVCWGATELAEQKRISPSILHGVSVIVLLALCIGTYRQLGYWRDNVILWSHAIDVTQGNFLAENNLGKALLDEGRIEEGIAHFYKAAAIYPADPVSNLNIGIYEQKQGNYSAAIERYQKTLGITRDPELRIAALKNMAAAYRRLGDSASAQQSLDAAAKLRPGF
jgi:protein O-mannosyl-transferase